MIEPGFKSSKLFGGRIVMQLGKWVGKEKF